MNGLSGDALAIAGGKSMGTDRKQFDMFFDKMLDGFAYHRIIVDKSGKPVDYVFLEINHVFEKMTGLKRERIIGKRVTEVLPSIENDPADWIGVYGKVALTEKPVQFENYNEALDKWFKVATYCPEKFYFVALFEDITESKRAEEKYRRLFEEAMDAIFLADAKTGLIIDCNNAALKMVGCEKSEIVGQPQLSLHPPEEAEGKLGRSFRRHLTDPDCDVLEAQVIRKNGELINVAIKANIVDLGGKKFLQGIFRDITDRKKAEEALKSTSYRFYSSLSSMHGSILLVSTEGQVEFANQSFSNYFNLKESPEELTGLSSEKMIEKIKNGYLDPDKQVVRIKEILDAGKTVVGEEVAMQSGRTCLRDFIPLYTSGKSFSRLWHHIDITERKKVEEALRASEKKASDLIKYAPSGIYELDYRMPPKFRSVNDAMCQILGYTREELLATSPLALLDNESKRRFQERIVKMLSGEKVDETVEFKVVPKDGREIYAVLDVTFTQKDGKPDGALVVAHDVTKRRRAEKELEKRAENLENLVEERTKALRDSERLAAIGATAGMVGHDIRNPLQAITGDIFLAKTELSAIPESEEKANLLENLQEIEKNVDYINKIVADLQDFARPLNPRIEETDLKSVIVELFNKNSFPENVQVIVEVQSDATKVMVDSTFINRIMYNLVNNAVQAMPKSGKLTIRAIIDKKTNDTILTVEDTGVGIPEKVKNKLFTPMFTTKSKGQGFGLAVVKRMTEALGGTVSFESQEGEGTTFIVRLPSQGVKR